MSTHDFIVIGAGMAGASAAYELACAGRVLVLESETSAGYHTTGRSAAMYLESYGGATVRRLAKAGRPFLERPPPGFADHPVLAPRGALFIARADQGPALDALHGEVSALTPDVRRISPDEATSRVPVLRPEYLAGAMLEPDAMDMEVAAIHQGFLRGARRRGAEILLDTPVRGLAGGTGGWVVDTPRGEHTAPLVVNAAGAWCDEVADLAGVRPVGLVPKRRTAFTFEAPAGLDTGRWPLVIDVDEDFYFKPETGDLLASPADETPMAPCDVQPEDLDIAIAIDRLQGVTTLRVPRIKSRWAGLRSFVADKALVVGEDARAPGILLAGRPGRLRHRDLARGRPGPDGPGARQRPSRRSGGSGAGRRRPLPRAPSSTRLRGRRAVSQPVEVP